MNKYGNVLLLKVPTCPFPEPSAQEDMRFNLLFAPTPSLALASLCSFVHKHDTFGYQLKAIDLNIEGYTEPGVPIDTSSYINLMENVIKDSDYGVLALSVMFIFTVKWVDLAVKLSKKYHPDAKIIIGGGYASVYPERALTDHDADYAVIGEGEAALMHILNKLNNHTDEIFEARFPFDGYAKKDASGKVTINERRHGFLKGEDLPPAGWHYMNIGSYFRKSGLKVLEIEGSRGCPYKCTYCTVHMCWGGNVRYRPVDSLIHEISEIRRQYGEVEVYLVDDNPTFSRSWITEFLNELIVHDLNRGVRFQNFSVKHLDEEIIDLLIKAGLKQLTIAVETASQEMQARINKRLNFDKVREIVGIAKSRKLYVEALWMLGFPKETLAQIGETLAFARELRANLNTISIVLPYPGTKLFEDAKSLGVLEFDDSDLSRFDYFHYNSFKSDEWNYEQLKQIAYDANIELNFINNPCLDTGDGADFILEREEYIMEKLSEHIIANIVMGYLHKQRDNLKACDRYYEHAAGLFKKKPVRDTFIKYLSWDYPVTRDFNTYLNARGIRL
ncbi:MAG: B12-binding domain-containing radical SAM protein [Nitrospirae bacterium]|nr:B12-binding domain-containing radical SAM protein [Nitrospirota bacterium]